MRRENWREAITLFDRILSVKGVEGMPFIVLDCYNNKHKALAKTGRWREAYDCMGRAALKDSLYEKGKGRKPARTDRQIPVKGKRAWHWPKAAQRLSETRMYIAVGALCVLACAVLVSLYVQSQRRKARLREAEFARLMADTDRRLTRRYVDGLEAERGRLAKEPARRRVQRPLHRAAKHGFGQVRHGRTGRHDIGMPRTGAPGVARA